MACLLLKFELVWILGCFKIVSGYCGRDDYKTTEGFCVYNLWYFWLGIIGLIFLLITVACIFLKKRYQRRRAIQHAGGCRPQHKPATPVKPPPYNAPSQPPPPYSIAPMGPAYPPATHGGAYPPRYPPGGAYPAGDMAYPPGEGYPGPSGPGIAPPAYQSTLPGVAS